MLNRDHWRSRARGRSMSVLMAAGLLLAMTNPAPAGEQSTDTFRGTTPTASGDTVVSGEVTLNGFPVAGAEVVALLWPSSSTLERLKAGEPAPTRTVGRFLTGSDGRFALSLDPRTLESSHLEPDGSVNIQLVVGDAQHIIIWHFTATRSASPSVQGAWSNPRLSEETLVALQATGHGPTHLAIDIGPDAYVIEEGNEPDKWLDDFGAYLDRARSVEAARVTRFPRPAPQDPQPDAARQQLTGETNLQSSGCYTWIASGVYQTGRNETFVRAISWTGASITVFQEVGTSHNLGISVTDQTGVWTTSGTQSMTSGASNQFTYGPETAARNIRNRVNYRRWFITCHGQITAESWRPHSFHSLITGFTFATLPQSWSVQANCTSYSAGHNPIKTQGANVTYASGVDITPIKVSARAVFSSSTKLRWNVVQSGGWLCGSTNMGWVSSAEAGYFTKP